VYFSFHYRSTFTHISSTVEGTSSTELKHDIRGIQIFDFIIIRESYREMKLRLCREVHINCC